MDEDLYDPPAWKILDKNKSEAVKNCRMYKIKHAMDGRSFLFFTDTGNMYGAKHSVDLDH